MVDTLASLFAGFGLDGEAARLWSKLLLLLLAILAAWLVFRLVTGVVLRAARKLILRSRTNWDDFLLKNKVLNRLAYVAPALVLSYAAPLFEAFEQAMRQGALVWILFVALSVFYGLLNTVVDIYNTYPVSRNKPIKGYIQVVKILVAIYLGAVVLATLLGKSPLTLLSGLGAMTAVLLLVFKDSILGLVASIQLSFNNMVRIGDWIEMPAFNADGTVVDMTLHTVKVQNWDKTVSTIPAYALVTHSFRNYRGMEESGGRRVMRKLHIDLRSIHFLTKEELDRLQEVELIADLVRERRRDTRNDHATRQGDPQDLINGRAMTNIGTFRAYVEAYLKATQPVHPDHTFLVRQLEPGPTGLPLQIYFFSTEQRWVYYEGIQSDIFDHLLATLPAFGLRLFQQPSGHDLRESGAVAGLAL